jgi:hypothetical protein
MPMVIIDTNVQRYIIEPQVNNIYPKFNYRRLSFAELTRLHRVQASICWPEANGDNSSVVSEAIRTKDDQDCGHYKGSANGISDDELGVICMGWMIGNKCKCVAANRVFCHDYLPRKDIGHGCINVSTLPTN